MFSVVIPLYNKEISINSTIQSVLTQTFQDFEIIIINDGSTDDSAKVVEQISDDRIRLICQENKGVSAARNRGIKEAKYEWIAFLDGDDLWGSKHLEEVNKMINLFSEELVFVTSFEYSDNRKMFKYSRQAEIFKIEDYFKEAIKENLIWTSIVVVNKKCFNIVSLFNEKLNRGEDRELWARLAKSFSIVKSSNVTAVYCVDAENRTDSPSDLEKCISYYIDFNKIISKSEKKYFQNLIIMKMRHLIKYRRLRDFFILYKMHRNNISILKVFSI